MKCRKNTDKSIYLVTHILLLAMNLSLMVPITVMIKGQRRYPYGLIPAIAMATYTTYRVTTAVMNACKSKSTVNVFVHELRVINFTDAMLSLLTLQNALITALDSMNEDMHTLITYTSIFIWFVINASTILSFRKIRIIQKQEAV